MMHDRLERPADITEHLAYLLLAGREPPLWEIDLGIRSEQIEDRSARRGDTTVVKGLEIFQGDGLALLISHGQLGDGHWILLPFLFVRTWAQPPYPRRGTQQMLPNVQACAET